MQFLCLQVATAARDYPFDLFHLLMCNSGGAATSHFCCNEQPLPIKSILAVHLFSVAVVRIFSLVDSGFTYQQGLCIIAKLYKEASVFSAV